MEVQINHYNCIYLYINKINGHTYIGKAKDFNNRHKGHIYSSNNKNSKDYRHPFHNAIRKYGIENFEIKILAENIPDEKIGDYEKFFIKRYKSLKTQNGYNIANGGEGGNTYIGKTEEEIREIKRKQSESRSGNKNGMYGKHHTEEAKQKIGEASKGRDGYWKTHKISEETKQKMSENHADFTGKNHPQAKQIIQCDLNMNIINIWGCSKDITNKFNWNNRTFRCHLDGRCPHEYKGFVWYYKDEYEKLYGSTGRN